MAKRVGSCLLATLLDKAGISQQDLADKVDTSKQQINKYVKNHQVMSYGMARDIAKVLNVAMEDLYED